VRYLITYSGQEEQQKQQGAQMTACRENIFLMKQVLRRPCHPTHRDKKFNKKANFKTLAWHPCLKRRHWTPLTGNRSAGENRRRRQFKFRHTVPCATIRRHLPDIARSLSPPLRHVMSGKIWDLDIEAYYRVAPPPPYVGLIYAY
jgi:hypothetical protein